MLYKLGEGSLASWDEAIYAAVAKEILRSGDWFRLMLAGDLWYDKPPLAIWATAFFYKAFGISEFSARLFSGLCGAGTVVVTYLIGRQLINRWVGLIGALVLLSSSHFLRFARFGMMDAPVTFFMSLALYFFWMGQFKKRYFIPSGVAIGLAVMTKGFSGLFVLPITFLYCLFTKKLDILKQPAYWAGIVMAAVIFMPWHIYQWVCHHDAFVAMVLTKHSLRITQALEGHSGNYYFYIRTLVNKFHPWILFGIGTGPYFLYKAFRDKQDEIIFLTTWMYFIFLFLTFSQTKLNWYIIPIYPAFSLSIGYFMAYLFPEKHANFVRILFIVTMILHIPYSHIFRHDYSRDIKAIAPLVYEKVPARAPLDLYQYHEIPAAAFYMDRSCLYADTEEVFLEKSKQKDFYCLIHTFKLKQLLKKYPAVKIRVRGEALGLTLISK